MTISRISAGAFHNVFNAANTAVAGSYSAGDKLLLFTGEYMGSNTISTPASWTRLNIDSTAHQIACFGLDGVGGDTIPAISWGNQWSWAIVLAYRGVASIATALDVSKDRTSVTNANIVGPGTSTTPAQNGELVLFVGHRDKTSASDASTFTAPSGFTMVAQQTQSGSKTAVTICEQIQGSASTVAANLAASGSVTDATNQSMQAFIILLKPAAAGFSPPPSRRLQTTYEPVYIYD